MKLSGKRMLCVDAVLLAVLLFADQFTKHLAVLKLKGQEAFVLINGVLELDYLENRGSAFGMLQDQKFLIVAVDLIFMAVLLFLLVKLPADRKYVKLHILMTMVMGGGIGNMIDRLRLDHVVDFISFVLIHYPIFNVADIYIVVAVILLFILFVFVYKEEDLTWMNLSFK
ncbi:MAG: signal peptidase II [Lachnospiraceae bacterium]|nr:signal peptidase II [Lachnospiraceae bacterium]